MWHSASCSSPEFVAKISPRPILILHGARDRVTTYEEAFSLVRLAKPPVGLHPLDGTDHFVFVDPDPRIGLTLRSWLDRYFSAAQRPLRWRNLAAVAVRRISDDARANQQRRSSGRVRPDYQRQTLTPWRQ